MAWSPRYPDVQIRLTGKNGNAFLILGTVQKGAPRGGRPQGGDLPDSTRRPPAGTTTISWRPRWLGSTRRDDEEMIFVFRRSHAAIRLPLLGEDRQP
jgi:hypothetical protein